MFINFLLFTSLTIGVFSRPQKNQATILKEVIRPNIDKFDFEFETSDGVRREEQGKLQDDIWTVRGFYSFVGDDGKPHTTQFIADDKGYRQVPAAADLSKGSSRSSFSGGVAAAPLG